MSEDFNPWDERPVLAVKINKKTVCRSLSSLGTTLKANILHESATPKKLSIHQSAKITLRRTLSKCLSSNTDGVTESANQNPTLESSSTEQHVHTSSLNRDASCFSNALCGSSLNETSHAVTELGLLPSMAVQSSDTTQKLSYVPSKVFDTSPPKSLSGPPLLGIVTSLTKKSVHRRGSFISSSVDPNLLELSPQKDRQIVADPFQISHLSPVVPTEDVRVPSKSMSDSPFCGTVQSSAKKSTDQRSTLISGSLISIPSKVRQNDGKATAFSLLPSTIIDDTSRLKDPHSTASLEEEVMLARPTKIAYQQSTEMCSSAQNKVVSSHANLETKIPKQTYSVSAAPQITRRRAIPSGNYIKLNIKKKCFSKGGTRRQFRLRSQFKRDKFNKKFGKTGSFKSFKGASTKRGVCFRCNHEGHWAAQCPLTIGNSKAKTPADHELMEPNFAPSEWQVADLASLDSRWRQIVVLSDPGYALSGLQKFHSPATALVVSPLISLMQDQIVSLTGPVCGAYLSSSQTRQQKDEILSNARNGQYAYILMSPEALVESEWMLQPDRLPPISFVCIDEAHCLADWSHHFRPSYLRVCSLLRTRLSVDRFLGLSATCTPSTIINICHNLGISKPHPLDSFLNVDELVKTSQDTDTLTNLLTADGFLQPVLNPLPPNLLITASMDANREEALIHLLTHPPFNQQISILVYAATRELTERLAIYIRTSLQEKKDKIGRRSVGWTTAVYHAGLSSTERLRTQKKFMNGRVRVLVATTAFGMGLNKRNLQAVIHYSLPKSYENYIQVRPFALRTRSPFVFSLFTRDLDRLHPRLASFNSSTSG
ncbi:unnamed protein product [Dibothriocephalus latus]|uniref:DNA 3'-5' helicase n=1 Tax=Dibothriocephalus latus TaxID=60516 RepID=A0A3P7L336_DIBLA|nr:unnamed protein product [Dibothriocephalus latus]